MKTLGFIASFALLLGLSSSANAETYVTKNDPTGVAMCFDSAGAKAPLQNCQVAVAPETSVSYVSRTDPAGGVMCFDTTGKLAPIAKCSSKPVAGAPAIGLVARIARLR